MLASSGKDRAINIYRESNGSYMHIVQKKNAHKRIVWDCWYVMNCIRGETANCSLYLF